MYFFSSQIVDCGYSLELHHTNKNKSVGKLAMRIKILSNVKHFLKGTATWKACE